MERFFVISHVIASAVWIGAVFMGAFIDWPAAQNASGKDKFPFDFIVGQGTRVFPAVYLGIVLTVVSSVGLTLRSPPQTQAAWALLVLKGAALSFMIGSTLYGTLVSWPKLQFATHGEAFHLYRNYIRRAYIVFFCGLAGIVAGLILSRQSQWLVAVGG